MTDDLNVPDAPPVTLAESVAQVEAWRVTEGMPLTGLHRIAQVLHGALEGNRLYRDTLLDLLAKARDEIDARDVRLQSLQLELNAARDENAHLKAEIERLGEEFMVRDVFATGCALELDEARAEVERLTAERDRVDG